MKTSLAALPALLLFVAPLAAQETVSYVPATPQLKSAIVNRLPQPPYPAALRDKVPPPSGSVGLRVYVGATGAVDNVKVVKSSRVPELDQHAQDHARKSFKFSAPYKVGDKPTPWMFDWTANYKTPTAKPAAAATPADTTALRRSRAEATTASAGSPSNGAP